MSYKPRTENKPKNSSRSRSNKSASAVVHERSSAGRYEKTEAKKKSRQDYESGFEERRPSKSRSDKQGGRSERTTFRSRPVKQEEKHRVKAGSTPKASGPKSAKLEEIQSIRLNKFIADAGIASRRKADELIANGEVRVNGRIVTELGTMVTKADNVTVGGDPVSIYKHHKYLILNKPKDYITTTSDEKDRKTVMDIVKSKDRIYPVGRLDRNTTGVLLLTNDGELANRLMHPKYHVERTYHVGLDKKIKSEDAQKIADGIELEDGKTSPCEVFINPDDRTKLSLTMAEGKNREVRRIFEHLGYEVKRLDRKSYAGLTTRGLERGDYRHLTKTEVMKLQRLVGL